MSDAMTHPADRLMEAIERRRAPVCVGLDPVFEKLPNLLRSAPPAQAIETFSCGVIDAVADAVPCVKFQSACYERYGSAGVAALERSVKHARGKGVQVILDAKRGDIGISASHYAAAAFDGLGADWLTVNGYLGDDSLQAFARSDHGLFILVRTSNPGGDQLQERRLEDGRTIAETLGSIVAQLGRAHIGKRGFSSFGAVVGATRPDTARRLREQLPEQIFLVPGYGAQGGGGDEVLPCFHENGRGAIVTASRSVIYAFKPDEAQWADGISEAATEFAETVGRATGWRT